MNASPEEHELDLVLAAVRAASGIEFRNYARTTLRRRIDEVVRAEGLGGGRRWARSPRAIRRWRRGWWRRSA